MDEYKLHKQACCDIQKDEWDLMLSRASVDVIDSVIEQFNLEKNAFFEHYEDLQMYIADIDDSLHDYKHEEYQRNV